MKPFFFLALLLFAGLCSSAQEANSKVSQTVSFRLMDLSVMDMASVLPAVLSTTKAQAVSVQSNGQWMVNKEVSRGVSSSSSSHFAPVNSSTTAAKTIYTLSKA